MKLNKSGQKKVLDMMYLAIDHIFAQDKDALIACVASLNLEAEDFTGAVVLDSRLASCYASLILSVAKGLRASRNAFAAQTLERIAADLTEGVGPEEGKE